MKKDIEINAFTFVDKQGLRGIPRIITVDDRQYSFIDSGLRYLVHKGEHLIRLFDMTDGQSTYRLKSEDNQWTLVSIKALP